MSGPVVDSVTVVRAEFSKHEGDAVEVKQVRLSISRIDPTHGPVVQMYGGPTGYESFYADDFLTRRMGQDGYAWMACGGWDGRWSRCFVPSDEMKHAFADLGLL